MGNNSETRMEQAENLRGMISSMKLPPFAEKAVTDVSLKVLEHYGSTGDAPAAIFIGNTKTEKTLSVPFRVLDYRTRAQNNAAKDAAIEHARSAARSIEADFSLTSFIGVTRPEEGEKAESLDIGLRAVRWTA